MQPKLVPSRNRLNSGLRHGDKILNELTQSKFTEQALASFSVGLFFLLGKALHDDQLRFKSFCDVDDIAPSPLVNRRSSGGYGKFRNRLISE